MPPNTVYVGRPTIWGSPFKASQAIEAGYLVGGGYETPYEVGSFLKMCFRDWLTDAGLRGRRDWWQGPESDRRKAAIWRHLDELRGKDLACWCPLDVPCHADVLLEWANA